MNYVFPGPDYYDFDYGLGQDYPDTVEYMEDGRFGVLFIPEVTVPSYHSTCLYQNGGERYTPIEDEI